MSANGSATGLTTDELRAAVRAVLRDVLPTGMNTTPAASDGEVAICTDADLAAFVRRVAVLCEDASARADLQAGRHRFRLVIGANGRDQLDRERLGLAATPAARAPSTDSVVRVDRGAVTERAVKAAAADGKRLIVGRRAVLTPLARDKARSLGVVIEKES